MDYFLERIDGLSSEDLTTEMLSFFLDSPSYAPYQRLFYSLIFPNQDLRNTEERQYDITTQRVFEGAERPDLVIEGEEEIVFIENKFYASFSGGNQMYVYFSRLINNFKDKEKYLILLTIKDRKELYLKDIRSQFNQAASLLTKEEVFEYCSNKRVKLKVITWEDIFKLFDTSDVLIANLTKYIMSKYLASTILKKEELAMLQNEDVPLLLNKLWAGIDKIKDILSSGGYSVTRTSQSRIFYAFRVERAWGKIWVTYDHYCWLNYNTPYVLSLRNEMLKETYQFADLEFRMSKVSFIYDKTQGYYIFPIRITEADLAGSTSEIVKEKLAQLDEMFANAIE